MTSPTASQPAERIAPTLLADVLAASQAHIDASVAEGATPAEAEAEVGDLCTAVADAFDAAPPIDLDAADRSSGSQR